MDHSARASKMPVGTLAPARRSFDLSARPKVDGLVVAGLAIVGLFMLFAALDLGGQVVLWENAHWTAAGLVAFVLAANSARRTTGTERQLRWLVALGAAAWTFGQLSWDIQTATGYFSVPAPSDLGYLGFIVPISVALVVSIRGRLPRAEEVAVYLDAAVIFLAIAAAILAAYGDRLAGYDTLAEAVTLAYPILHVGIAGAALVVALAARATTRFGGAYLLLGGLVVLGFSWVAWLGVAVNSLPAAGSSMNYAFSIGMLAVGIGGAGWQVEPAGDSNRRRLATIVHGSVPLIALLASAAILVLHHVMTPDLGLIDVSAFGVILVAGVRQTLLVHERGRLLDDSGRARNDLEIALIQRAEADSRYRVLVERVPAAVYIDVADPSVTDGGRLEYMSPQIEAILGYRPDEFLADPELWPGLIHPEDRAAALEAYEEHWATDGPLRADYRMISRNGEVVWVHDEAYSMTDGPAAATGRRVSQGLLVNTTDQKQLEARLVHDALHDPLTGLANRVLFSDHVERALASRRRSRTEVALLFLDLDDFKVVNDSLGHRAGDRLLVEVAHRLSGAIRAGDVAARQGGDEFTVLLDQVNGLADAVASAERLTAELRRPIELEGRSIVIGVSVGIALAGDETEADDLLAHADAAMYAAKAQGRARHAVFDPSMRVRARSRLEMEAELRDAIENEAFELHYQPIVELATGGIVGFEALVRWRHPERGLVPPNDFIPLAEASGLIVELGRLVTRSACRQMRALLDAMPGLEKLTMSVNVSPRQAVEHGFAAEVAEILAATGLEPSSLVLEITESLMLHESAASDGALRTLRDMGVHLVVDDFGTGFSALEYFKRFAVQGLKIDRSFVDGLGPSPEDTAIVTATLAFASALGLAVTAEGVETVDQLERLRALGCERAQGYLFSRPIPAAALAELLATGVRLGPPAAEAA